MKNFLYILINGTYFASYASVHAFATAYLMDKGFTSTEIGFILAISNIIAVIVQTIATSIIDSSKKITSTKMILWIATLTSVGIAILYFFDSFKIIITTFFILIFMLQVVYQPLITALFFEYLDKGYKIKFGLARGCGSVGFALASMYIGFSIDRFGINSLLIFAFLMNFIFIIMMIIFSEKPSIEKEKSNTIISKNKKETFSNPIKFFRKYPQFSVFLISVFFIFFTHNMLNDFLIFVIERFESSKTALGNANFIQAFLELPAMIAVPYILKKIKVQKIIFFSAIFFLIKTLLITFATNLNIINIGQSMQMFAYAVFTPASAYFTNMTMDENDQYKGQSYVMCAITLSGVLSNLICGRIIDIWGVSEMLNVGIISTTIGLIVMISILIPKSKAKNTKIKNKG